MPSYLSKMLNRNMPMRMREEDYRARELLYFTLVLIDILNKIESIFIFFYFVNLSISDVMCGSRKCFFRGDTTLRTFLFILF